MVRLIGDSSVVRWCSLDPFAIVVTANLHAAQSGLTTTTFTAIPHDR